MKDDIKQMLEDCDVRRGRLNSWERGFIDSVTYQYALNGKLTRPQENTLNEIWEKATEEG